MLSYFCRRKSRRRLWRATTGNHSGEQAFQTRPHHGVDGSLPLPISIWPPRIWPFNCAPVRAAKHPELCWIALNAGVPLIVNAHGSVAELPVDAVWMLKDEFSNADLISALETLYQNEDKRDALSRRAREVIATRHAPENCAQRYAEAIEAFYAARPEPACPRCSMPLPPHRRARTRPAVALLAQAIARSLPTKRPARQLLLDVSATCRTELKTGIERWRGR